MNFALTRHYSRVSTEFVVLLAAAWGAFYFILESRFQLRQDLNLLFILSSGIFSYFALKILGYFDSLRIFPRKSDLFLVIFALPVSALAAHFVLAYAFGLWICPVRTILFWTPLLSAIVFGVHFGISCLSSRSGRRKKIVLDLLPTERDLLIKDFSELGRGDYIEFLSISDLKRHFLEGRVSEVNLIVISREAAHQFDVDATLIRAHLAGIPIVDHRKVSTDLAGRIRLSDTDLWTYVMAATPQTSLLRAFSRAKVVIEPILAAILLVVFSPVMLALALIIRKTSEGPIFYAQVRTGYLGKNFKLIKFRSMRSDSEANGPQWSSRDDERVTAIGKIMRGTRLDELPQLWNVIKGEMSFFGPRPERPEIYMKLKKEIPLFSMRTIVRPGITGWAQVCAGYAGSVEESRLKLEYDLFYIQHMSPRLDLIILVKTMKVALFGSSVEFRTQQDQLKATGS